MTEIYNPYDNLLANLKNRLTIVCDGKEYNMSDYMLNKNETCGSSSNLPVAAGNEQKAIVAVVNYVNERLTVKKPPVKDKTIRRFPLRTSVSALLSAVAACALMVSCCIYAITGTSSKGVTYSADSIELVEVIEDYRARN